MNFQTILEELDRLYEEENVKKENEKTEDTVTETEQELTEAAEDISDEEEIIDDEEPAADELKQLILECDKCGALVIKAEEDVKIDDATDLANVDEVCHFCEEAAGCKIIGIVAPYEATEDVEPVEDEIEEEGIIEESSANNSVEESDEELTELLNFDVPISASVNIKADGNNVPFLNTALEELDTTTDEGDNVELEEGVFDKKNSVDYRNKETELNTAIKQATDGKTESMEDIARDIAVQIGKAFSEYCTQAKQDDKYDTDQTSLVKQLESTQKVLIGEFNQLMKEGARLNVPSTAANQVKRVITGKLGNYSDTSLIADNLSEYYTQLRAIEKKYDSGEIDKRVFKDACKKFSLAYVNQLKNEQADISRISPNNL